MRTGPGTTKSICKRILTVPPRRGCRLSAMDACGDLYSLDYINLVEPSLSLQNGHLRSFVPLDYVHAPFKTIMNGFPTKNGSQNALST